MLYSCKVRVTQIYKKISHLECMAFPFRIPTFPYRKLFEFKVEAAVHPVLICWWRGVWGFSLWPVSLHVSVPAARHSWRKHRSIRSLRQSQFSQCQPHCCRLMTRLSCAKSAQSRRRKQAVKETGCASLSLSSQFSMPSVMHRIWVRLDVQLGKHSLSGTVKPFPHACHQERI